MSYVTELTNTLQNSKISEADRQAILRSLWELKATGNEEAMAALKTLEPGSNLPPSRNFLDLDPLTAIAQFQARQQTLYDKYKAQGLTGQECVNRFREFNVHGHLPLHYSLIQADAQTCEKADKSALFRYCLVTLYGHFRQTPDYDWPARELAEATLSRYLPCEWLSRKLFEAMAEMELHIKLDLCGNAMDQSVKSRPAVELVREVKAKFPDCYGWIPDRVNYVVNSFDAGVI